MDVRTQPRVAAALTASALAVLLALSPSAALALDGDGAVGDAAATAPLAAPVPVEAPVTATGGAPEAPEPAPAATVPVALSARVTLSGRTLQAGELSVQLLRDGAVVQAVPCAADGTVAFAPVEVAATGESTLSLRMAPTAAAGVTVDARAVPVSVVLAAGPDGAPVATVSYGGAPEAPTFSNVYRHPAGWEAHGQSRRYYLADGTYVANAWRTVDGLRYRFDAEGHPRTGWYEEGGTRYYLDPATGAARTGWLDLAGQRYYLDASGAMRVGWVDVAGQRYWLRRTDTAYGPKGSVGSGWLTEGGQTYFLRRAGSPYGPKGTVGTGWLTEGGQTYFLRRSDNAYGPKGSVGSGWLTEGGQTYFLRRANSPYGPKGTVGTGWLTEGGHTYFLRRAGSAYGPKGTVGTGWLREGGRSYFLRRAGSPWGPKGSLGKGWLSEGGRRYYLGPDGAMWVNRWVSGTYWVGSSGVMATNAWVDGGRYWVDASGRRARPSVQTGMDGRAQGYSSPTPYLILVDNSANRVGVYRGGRGGWTKVRFMTCSCGKPSTPTVRGTFSVGSKGYSFGENKGYSCYYWTQFHGDYLFHSILYNPYTWVVQDGRLGASLSHGCVRLAIGDAKWIHDTIPRGTTVVSY